jgi:hypothetical protein
MTARIAAALLLVPSERQRIRMDAAATSPDPRHERLRKTLPHFLDCPVTRRFALLPTEAIVALDHAVFQWLRKHRNPDGEGGAVLLFTHDSLVLGMDYATTDALDEAWHEALCSYPMDMSAVS